jgi:hypothetical protein
LKVDAENSSLSQILKDVATATGSSVEGFDQDRRVFGAYGPGQARDVLSQLLQGSGYNVLMIGDLGQGAPREIVLTSRDQTKTDKPSEKKTATEEEEDDTDQAAQQVQPVPPQQPVRPNSPFPQDQMRRIRGGIQPSPPLGNQAPPEQQNPPQ